MSEERPGKISNIIYYSLLLMGASCIGLFGIVATIQLFSLGIPVYLPCVAIEVISLGFLGLCAGITIFELLWKILCPKIHSKWSYLVAIMKAHLIPNAEKWEETGKARAGQTRGTPVFPSMAGLGSGCVKTP